MVNDALEDLGMKIVHITSFCPTKMSCILTGCKQTVTNLVPLCMSLQLLITN